MERGPAVVVLELEFGGGGFVQINGGQRVI
jgi:hypothetical protein